MPPRETFGPRWVAALKIQIAVVWIMATPTLAFAAWLAGEAFANREFRTETSATREQLRELADESNDDNAELRESIDQRLRQLEADVRVCIAVLERLERSTLKGQQ